MEGNEGLLIRLRFACGYHAEEAIRLWTVAIERTGTSKFDVEKAKEQQKITEEAFRAMRIIGRNAMTLHATVRFMLRIPSKHLSD
jgi:hypothetical protein